MTQAEIGPGPAVPASPMGFRRGGNAQLLKVIVDLAVASPLAFEHERHALAIDPNVIKKPCECRPRPRREPQHSIFVSPWPSAAPARKALQESPQHVGGGGA
jgi:hypothetical protein